MPSKENTMKLALVLAGFAGAFVVVRAISHRLATHQAVLPGVANRINTRVTRINQG